MLQTNNGKHIRSSEIEVETDRNIGRDTEVQRMVKIHVAKDKQNRCERQTSIENDGERKTLF